MDHRWILPVPEYYARLNAYILEVGLPYSVADCQQWDAEITLLRAALGDAGNQAVLDCSCGWGRQTIALAKLGWQVSACDVSETSLEFARKFAAQEGLSVDFRVCDMRDLPHVFSRQFDWVVSCYALYEIPSEEGIRQAIHGIGSVLKPGGKCYLRFRDMDFLMEEQPRHTFHGETRTPTGRVICIEDWEYESETEVVALDAFLREDERLDPSDHFRWVTETVGCRKRVMRKAELERLLRAEGFAVTFLPQSAPWMPVEVVATQ
jgi:ubiquinone/menaquinone biosynthesis C-methylase UbiE